jgi:hypothetical protein
MSRKLLENAEEFLLGKPKRRGLFGGSRRSKVIPDEYYNRIISFFCIIWIGLMMATKQ